MKKYIFTNLLSSHIIITISASSMDTAMSLLSCIVSNLNNFELYKVEQ